MTPGPNPASIDEHRGKQKLFTTFWQLTKDLLLIGSGSILCAIAINSILIPQKFTTGGITGLSLVLHKAIPYMKVEWLYLLLNIPLFSLAWMTVGRRFFFYSILGALMLTTSLSLIFVPIHLDDRMLSALLAGIILGVGAGLTLRSSGSQGGLDILSILLMKRYSISLGNTVLVMNAIVLSMVAFFYSLDAVLYTLVVLFVSSKVLEIVVTGLSKRKAVFIISPHWRQIADEILKDIRRGVTIVKGEGGYSGNREHIIYTVVTIMEIGNMKSLIQKIDPNAFVVISDTMEVINYRIGNQPHW